MMDHRAERRRLLNLRLERPLNRKERTRLRNVRRSLGRAEMREMAPHLKAMERQLCQKERFAKEFTAFVERLLRNADFQNDWTVK
jgi:hypothetical protein